MKSDFQFQLDDHRFFIFGLLEYFVELVMCVAGVVQLFVKAGRAADRLERNEADAPLPHLCIEGFDQKAADTQLIGSRGRVGCDYFYTGCARVGVGTKCNHTSHG